MTTALFAQKSPSRQLRSKAPSTLMQSNVKGVVRMDPGSCGMHIEVPVKGGSVNFFPVNLPDNFQAEGSPIFFDYTRVDADFKSGCDITSAISVANVKNRRHTLSE